jgi:NADH:ubiquinone oxidoreductase subunit F (NADH-binding)/Pyruvate/2-oxoacid:ferredoxin oxidoreductase delta subunit
VEAIPVANKTRVLVGMGTCGLAAGARDVFQAVSAAVADLGLEAQVVATGCVGFCSREVIVDFAAAGGPRVSYGPVTAKEAPKLLRAVLVERCHEQPNLLGQYRHDGVPPLPGIRFLDEHPYNRKQVRVVLERCGVIDPMSLDEYRAHGGYRGLQRALALGGDGVVAEVLASGLRGRGGGGFPTGQKWKMARAALPQHKHIICNADEGDPGAFMDRSVLEGDPFCVVEGMTIGALAMGAQEGTIYARAEYPLAIERLGHAIAVAEKEGFLGDGILGSSLSLHLHVKKGAGAFVCGEETALMASIEGKRGMPRPRPPYPVESGVFGKPTVINNVETFANVPAILARGAAWFSSMGVEGSRGTKVFALTGKVQCPGLVEVPMGIPLREVVFDVGGGIPDGHTYKAAQIGGPSGGCIPQAHLDIPITYDSLKTVGAMMGSGGLVIMDDTTCMVDVAKFFMDFITRESCGKCIPCREGTKRMLETLEAITTAHDQGTELDGLTRFKGVIHLEQLARVVRDASLCGLGMSAPNPVLSTLRFFRDEYEAHIYDRRCPAGACTGLLTFTIDNDKCVGCGACLRKCPAGAIVGEPKRPHYVVADKCVRCGQCRQCCPVDAVRAA